MMSSVSSSCEFGKKRLGALSPSTGSECETGMSPTYYSNFELSQHVCLTSISAVSFPLTAIISPSFKTASPYSLLTPFIFQRTIFLRCQHPFFWVEDLCCSENASIKHSASSFKRMAFFNHFILKLLIGLRSLGQRSFPRLSRACLRAHVCQHMFAFLWALAVGRGSDFCERLWVAFLRTKSAWQIAFVWLNKWLFNSCIERSHFQIFPHFHIRRHFT